MSAFQPISSIIEPSFWQALSKKKLNDMMLDEHPFDVNAFFQCGRSKGISSFCFLNEESFVENLQKRSFTNCLNYVASFKVSITLVNTQSKFKTLDRSSILKELGSSIYQAIDSGSWISQPSVLLRSALTVYGDLKKWQFFFCFAFPTANLNSVTISDKKELPSTEEFDTFPDWAFALNSENKAIPLSEATAESTFVIIDPSTSDDLGWPAHILSLAISKTFKVNQFKLIRLNHQPYLCTVTVTDMLSENTNFIGWKLNKKKPFFVDLSSTMDPLALFSSASYLNLRLMKWRMCPQLDVDQIRLQSALLIGCGTLGCNVARDLLGWGVRKFTLVDYGNVSFSNPPRQPLFCFNDCLNGGRPKSEAAAEELKRICPDVEATFDSFEIPMPGHRMVDGGFDKVKLNVEKLDKMIQDNDVTFLLTDTRESRWLPTVIGAARKKLCISIALGFDTFSVVRSGTSEHVGCYFCNDIVAPVDSMTDRTLDMQCTVTRPGIAPLASAVGVELWAAMTQVLAESGKTCDKSAKSEGDFDKIENDFEQNENELHHNCEKDCGKNSKPDESVLGQVPHQIRGFLHNWQVLPMSGDSFKCCVGCARPIVEGYIADGAKFVTRAMNEPNFLEDVSGITEMKKSMVDEDCDWVDE